MGMIFGYARVSAKDQNLDRQIKELEEFEGKGCDKIFKEKQSGKNFDDRTVYKKMRSQMRFGDLLVVHDLSRFGRNKEDIKKEWQSLVEDEIDIVLLNMPMLDTRRYKNLEGVGALITEIVLALLSWMVEEERTRIKTAQREGIEIAKKKGTYKGRTVKYHENATGKDKIVYDEVVRSLNQGISVRDIHKRTGLARNTIYGIRDRLKEKSPNDRLKIDTDVFGRE